MIRSLPALALLACTAPPVGVVPAPVPEPVGPTDPVDGDLAPDFALQQQDGSTFVLSDHRGDVILVDIAGFT